MLLARAEIAPLEVVKRTFNISVADDDRFRLLKPVQIPICRRGTRLGKMAHSVAHGSDPLLRLKLSLRIMVSIAAHHPRSAATKSGGREPTLLTETLLQRISAFYVMPRKITVITLKRVIVA